MKGASIVLMLFISIQGVAAMPGGGAPAQDVLAMVGHDHFAATANSQYAGVSDSALRIGLNAKIDAAATALATAASTKASTSQLLAILKQHLDGIDRDALDTEDAEHVADLFEKMLDSLGIQSSDGILNDWFYGFDPT